LGGGIKAFSWPEDGRCVQFEDVQIAIFPGICKNFVVVGQSGA
jgi:hypothetical protein